MEYYMELPGEGLQTEKMPGHWLLARLGKRVLRPGGLELTRQMLDALAITNDDHVVEFAPGLGITAKLTLAQSPAAYTAVEADANASEMVQGYLTGEQQRCVVGRAENTGLPDVEATVVYGEAMLTMQTPGNKTKIVREAKRLLQPGGRCGIHEMCLVPDDLAEGTKQEISRAMSDAIHVGARPLTIGEWQTLLENEGFRIKTISTAPMHLLEPSRIIRDEGIGNTMRIMGNILRDPKSPASAYRQCARSFVNIGITWVQ
ncbi:MAG: methyltransferase domain-containing protein [Chloroflexota bacterium]